MLGCDAPSGWCGGRGPTLLRPQTAQPRAEGTEARARRGSRRLPPHRLLGSLDAARTAYAAFERTWGKRCPGVVTSVREGGSELLTFFRFPRAQWKTLRTIPALAAELVALKVDVIVASGRLAALAAQQATGTLPIVFSPAADPVASGLVTSLTRPGGNVTGLSLLYSELVGKWLEQLKQAIPGVSRVAVLWQPGAFGERTEKDTLKRAEVAARALGVPLQFVEARGELRQGLLGDDQGARGCSGCAVKQHVRQ
jgi:hypothetical protein